jgi:hypothetical protein
MTPTRLRPPRRRRPDSRLLRPRPPPPARSRRRPAAQRAAARDHPQPPQDHAPTIAYIERKTREVKTVREAIRCLKRYLARHLFRLLEAGPMAA